MSEDIKSKIDPMFFSMKKSTKFDDFEMNISPILFHATRSSIDKFIHEKTVEILIHSKDSNKTAKALEELNCKCKFSKNIVLSEIPESKLESIAAFNEIEFIESSIQAKPHLDESSKQNGINIPTNNFSNTGKDAIVGVIDTGIDWKHEDFIDIDSSGEKKSRILFLYDQTASGKKEFTNQEITDAINNNTSISPEDENGHGTHVAGIASGNGNASNGVFKGVAPESDLIIVKTDWSTASIAEAVLYIFDKATQAQKACVINMSLGWHIGSHDGRSAVEKIIDDSSGPGKIVCVSAGNEGNDNIFAGGKMEDGQFWITDFKLKPFRYRGRNISYLQIFLTHHKNDNIEIKLKSPDDILYDPSTNPDEEHEEGNSEFTFYKRNNRYTGNPEYYVTIYQEPIVSSRLSGWQIQAEAIDIEIGDIDSWIADSQRGEFTSNNVNAFLVGMPGTSFSALTVGSYNTKKRWESKEGTITAGAMQLDDLSGFSSPGPTRDYRNKPEICAPGNQVMSALSSDIPNDDLDSRFVHPTLPYQVMRGTSMSCPQVVGAIALILNQRPSMHFSEVKRRIIQSARQDIFTGNTWNQNWGYGKLDVAAVLNDL